MSKDTHSVRSRLDQLEKEVGRIRQLYERTMSYRERDPETALMHARKAAEAVCRQVFIKEVSPNAGNIMLDDLIDKLKSAGVLPKVIAIPLRTIQGYGNFAAHAQGAESADITADNIQPCLQALAIVVDWYFREYQPSDGPAVSEESAPAKAAPGLTAPATAHTAGKPIRVSEFASRTGMTAAAVIRVAREALHLELRTPSALLQPEHVAALQQRIAKADAAGPGGSVVPQVKAFDLGAGVSMALVLVPPGAFRMGSPVEEEGHNDDELTHTVVLSRPFYLGRHVVTQEQYQNMVGSNPSYFGGNRLPVEILVVRRSFLLRDPLREVRPEVPVADGGRVGVRVPRRHGDRFRDRRRDHNRPGQLRRQDRWPAGRSGRVALEDDPRGRVPAQRLGPPRHARQRLGMVRGLVRGILEG